MVRALGWLVLLMTLRVGLGSLPSAHAQATAKTLERRATAVLAASERALAAGRPDLAMRRLSQALARPNVQVLLRYGELALPLGGIDSVAELTARTARAEAYLGALARLPRVEATPEELRRALLHAAGAEALRGDYDAAFTRVLEAGRLQDAATVLCLRTIATIAAFRERLAIAGNALAQARQYMPQDVRVMAELGRVELARGRVHEAVAVLNERFGIEPQLLAARRDLAYALLSGGRADEALALLSAAREACGAHAGCALEAARAALSAGRADIALAFARGRLLHGVDLDALFLIADAHVHRGELAEARAAYGEVLKNEPASLRAQQALEQLPPSNAAPR